MGCMPTTSTPQPPWAVAMPKPVASMVPDQLPLPGWFERCRRFVAADADADVGCFDGS
eukprot:jgi/Psemu1/311104/fgenesh1_kg.721_\